jgi:hypothetical protein
LLQQHEMLPLDFIEQVIVDIYIYLWSNDQHFLILVLKIIV